MDKTVSFPWVDTQILLEGLECGSLNVTSAFTQFSIVVKDVLRIIEDKLKVQAISHEEFAVKSERMEKLINDLSEKCQAMQQALLYKEEKYDEKCRESERYKLICELSSKKALGENSQEFAPPTGGKIPLQHVKLKHPEASKEPQFNDRPKSDYLGGPTRSRAPTPVVLRTRESNLRAGLANIGAININGPRTNLRAVPISELTRPMYASQSDSDDRVKLELSGQVNEVISSSGNAVDRMRQKFTEKDLNRQLATGNWTRMTGRRRKEWPY